ncbi:GPN-loop GTPase 1-like [Convolutriloba macropyga]|uniref:GPN-loop GTPase 1-like n=1 Tax=Convolutriloba macropyga TaxID=536237 RepID=UPI003F526101
MEESLSVSAASSNESKSLNDETEMETSEKRSNLEEDMTCKSSESFEVCNIGAQRKKKSRCVIVLGMAGSGKTTFVRQLNSLLHVRGHSSYVINLDPAVNEVPYPVNIDIRDTVKYKQVMKEYGLGPNGAIMTSLNIFATKFDQVVRLLEKRQTQLNDGEKQQTETQSSDKRGAASSSSGITKDRSDESLDYVLVDTPGQIEVFTWSASGAIISESLAAHLPTMVVYVMDTQRSTSTVTFMSNMLYACSILYKSKLPFIVVMNKTDIVSHSFAEKWMRDWTVFEDALSQETSYVSNLARSMSLCLEEFYRHLRCVGLSSLAGVGFDSLLEQLEEATEEYERDYRAEYERLKKNKHSEDENRQKEQLEKFLKDHNPQIKESTRSKVTTTSATNQPMTSSASVINKDATDTVD